MATRYSPALRTALLGLLVAIGYYVGSRLGFVLRLPPATTSVLWPPNAFLTGVLLLSAPRRSWIFLLAVLPAHLLVQIQAGFQWPLIAALFVTNCLEALAAAAIVHRWSDAPARIDTLERVAFFVVGCVFVAPLLSSFADAAVVHAVRGEGYSVVWLRRVFSNTLSQLTIVPVVLLAAQGRSLLRNASPRRLAEATLLALALMTVGFAVFTGSPRDSPLLPGEPYTSLPLLLPLLIIAAVRFGPGGASLSLLATALIAIGAALAGGMPLRAIPVEERVRALQVFLIVVGVPLLVLAALIEERSRIAQSLRERLGFEELLSELSGAFAHTPAEELDPVFERWLERVGRLWALDRVVIWELDEEHDALVPVAQWSARSHERAPHFLPRSRFPWSARHMLTDTPLVWGDAETLPEEAAPERDMLRAMGVRSLVTLPLLAGPQVIGSLALVSTMQKKAWPPPLLQRGRLIADVFAGSLARRRAARGLDRTRQELAHAQRVSTIGELTTSLAHELNQPLAAIVANAQAARRMLAGPVRKEDLLEILGDVIADGKRAGEVIHRLRELLRKGETKREALDLNALVQEVVKLLGNDVMIRGVAMRLELERGPLATHGDRVQLRQVLLNLVVNALEALAETEGNRRVVIRTERLPGDLVGATVEDTGPGLASTEPRDVFKPFYTTKANGMGMGLSIARSILESHGGSILARNNRGGGASFVFTLPVSAAPSDP